MKINSLFATTALAGMLGAFVLVAPAHAQEDANAPQTTATTPVTPATTADDAGQPDIVVTGSRISRPDLEAASPVAVISGDAIKLQNSVTVEQILSANPQFGAGDNAAENNPGTGAASVDLRRLGTNRTLVLLDGKRLPQYDSTGAVDVNTIPTALIKRVDVLTGGASAVYGSDAIAGVVNFILDDRFVGLRADGSAQISQEGDGATYDASLTGGIKLGDRGNFIVSGNYSKRNGVTFGQRSFSDFTLDSSDLVSNGGSSNANPTVFDVNPDLQVQVRPDGSLSSDIDYYNFNPVNYGQIPLERYSGIALGRYELSDAAEVYARGMYEHVKVVTTLAPTATAGFTFNIDPTNPFLTDAERATFFDPTLATINDGSGVADDPTARAGTAAIGIRRRVVETGGRVEEHTTQNYGGLLGVRGNLGDFKYDVFGQYSEVKRDEIFRNDLSYTALQRALDVVNGPNGPQCFDPSGGCQPLNLFVTTPLTQTALSYVLRDALQNTKTTQFVTGANVGGDLGFLKSPLADLPAAVSVGVEYRKETARTRVSDDFASGDLIYYGQGQNISGSYDVKEVYGEIKMPLVQDRPGIYALNFEGGYRYSDYSTAGGVSSYKAGGDYSPFQGLRIRGIYQRAVRAPSVYELFSPVVAGTGSLNNDPCGAGNTISPTVRDICIAQGAPASAFDGTTSSIKQPISGQINGFFGGNPNLEAEKTDTYTIGAVFNPPSLRALSVSVDYYNIKIGNAISTTPAAITANQCYFVDASATAASCTSIVRNSLTGSLSGGTEVGLPELYGNVAAIKTRGLDVAVGYHGGDAAGFNWSLGYAGNFTFGYTIKSAPDADTVECVGTFGTLCDLEPMPKYKHVTDVSLGYGDFSLLARWRLIGQVHADANTPILKDHIPAYSYLDLTASWRIEDQYTFRLGVQNLTNTTPPIVGDTVGAGANAGSTFPGTYDFIGRSLFAGFTANF